MLFPFSVIYWVVIWVRNFLFDKNILKSSEFNFPIICIGNLAVGGTGKTPMTEFIVNSLHHRYRIAILSRGYGRKTKGFAVANLQTTAVEIGDEPMQFHLKFPEVMVAVGEERLVAIPQMLYQDPELDTILLDDAFQHRFVRCGLNILLTDYSNLYTRDLMLPAGDLRDIRSSAERADIIIVTKCSPELNYAEKIKIVDEINPLVKQSVYFTTIQYGSPYHLFNHTAYDLKFDDAVLLICGIANPEPLKIYLNNTLNYYDMMAFRDHHIFNSVDLTEIKKQYNKIRAEKKIILTTEKDAVRLHKFKQGLEEYPIYVLPIQHRFLFDDQEMFIGQLDDFISRFSSKQSN
jgi:tetraacyldisaccharide 4'-kinase